ncbi:formyltransferase family protein [Thalassospira sp. NFXS8]|uniref:formyltransferase family protein n=1 Tax=Thalassospira sp. NFXS8 TaxID=2819093 RepID=UPI0032DF5C2A
MRLAIFADGEVGEKILDVLLNQYQSDVAVVVSTGKNNIKRMADKSGIESLVFQNEGDLINKIPHDVDLGLLAWWPKIITEDLIKIPKMGFINTHPSFLPWNRGKHYNFWALVENTPFGVTLHKVDKGIDTGAIVAQLPIPYDWTDTGESLYHKAQNAMVELVKMAWPTIRHGDIPAIPQSANAGSFHFASELENASHIDLDKFYQGREILNLLRARTFSPHPGCWIEEDGQKYEISIRIRKLNQ